MIGLSRRKHLYESHCLALQWLPQCAVTSTRIAAQSTSDRSPTLSRRVARAGTWCSARRTSTSGSALGARFGRQVSASWD